MVVWGLSNFGGLATIPGQQEASQAVAPSHVKLKDIVILSNIFSFL